MAKTTRLKWWMEFAQTNLNCCYNKTKLRLITELANIINPLPDGNCQWHAKTIDFASMALFQDGALDVVTALKGSKAIPQGEIIVREKMEGATSCMWIDTNERYAKKTGIALTLSALREAEINNGELIGSCLQCENIFIQASMKRKKRYCSKNCRIAANKKKVR